MLHRSFSLGHAAANGSAATCAALLLDFVARATSASPRRQDFPPRSFPLSFNPANIVESTMDGIKQDRRLKQQIDLDRIRGGLNRMTEQQHQERGRR